MRILAWIGFLGLLGATGAMAGSYAHSVGLSHGPVWAWIAAAGAAALLVVEAALAAGRSTGEPWLRWPGLVLALAAVASLEVGFASSVFTDARAARQDARHQSNRAAAATEPASVWRLRLEAVEARHPGIRATWCSSKSAEARSACETWLRAREQLAIAEDAEAARGGRATGDTDARAALLSRVTGWAEAAWADWLVLLLAAAMSLARAAAASMLLGARPQINTATQSTRAPERVEETPDHRHVDQAAPAAPSPADAVDVPQIATEPEVTTPATPSPAEDLPEPARRVLRIVAAKAQPAPAGQGWLGFVPPGELSQRRLAAEAGLSRRTTSEALERLEAAGVVLVVSRGREGTEIALLRDAG